jgi:hypothetical protein
MFTSSRRVSVYRPLVFRDASPRFLFLSLAAISATAIVGCGSGSSSSPDGSAGVGGDAGKAEGGGSGGASSTGGAGGKSGSGGAGGDSGKAGNGGFGGASSIGGAGGSGGAASEADAGMKDAASDDSTTKHDGSPADASTDARRPDLSAATVTWGVYYPTTSTTISETLTGTVGPTTEFPDIENDALSGYFLADANVFVRPSSIDIEYHQATTLIVPSVTFDGYIFNFSPSTVPAITGAVLDSASTFSASQVQVTFAAHTVSVNIQGQTIISTSRILVDLSF